MTKPLKHILTAGAAALVCLTAIARPIHADPTPLDPALVGIWKASGRNLNWSIRSDSTYTLSGDLTDSGKLQASGGQWTTTSDTTNQATSGTYAMHGQTAVSTTGLAGAIDWQRAQPSDHPQSFGGDIRTWVPSYRKAPRPNPNDPKLRNDRGLELYRAGKKVAARREWQQVLKMGDAEAAKQARGYLARFR